MKEAIAQVAAEQGWGLDEAAIADAEPLEAWLRSGRRRAKLAPGSKDEAVFREEVSWERLRAHVPRQAVAHLFEVWVERRWDPDRTCSGSPPS